MLLESKCSVLDLLVVPDEIQEIQAAIKRWCSLGEVDWIITTGGTGFGRRDTTPEVRSLRHISCMDKSKQIELLRP